MFEEFKRQYKTLGIKNIIIYFIFQRIFRINSRTPWPVHWSSRVGPAKNIKFKGKVQYLGFSPGCYIQAQNGIEVGENVIIAAGVKIISANHDLYDYSKHTKAAPIKIGDNCWLGANCVILPGVELGNHTIVGAGAVVTKSFTEGNCILAGVPAKVIKALDDYNGE